MLENFGQRLGVRAVAGLLLLVTASALIWVGVGFAGYALYLAFLPPAGPPWAAAIAGAILITGPLAWAVIVLVRKTRPRPQIQPPDPRFARAGADNAALNVLAQVAQEKPLLAVVFAGILGASEAILRRKP
jgi:hypothetical protein